MLAAAISMRILTIRSLLPPCETPCSCCGEGFAHAPDASTIEATALTAIIRFKIASFRPHFVHTGKRHFDNFSGFRSRYHGMQSRRLTAEDVF